MTTEQINDSRAEFAEYDKWHNSLTLKQSLDVGMGDSFNAGWQACEAAQKAKVEKILGEIASYKCTPTMKKYQYYNNALDKAYQLIESALQIHPLVDEEADSSFRENGQFGMGA